MFFAGTYNGYPACVAAALATIDKVVRSRCTSTSSGSARRRGGLRRSLLVGDQPAEVSGYGSVFVTYFLDHPVRDYDDLLDNDVELFTGERLA